MEIFRGKKPRRGRRTEKSRRQSRRRRRHSGPADLLSDLVVEEAPGVPVTARRRTRRDLARETTRAGISLIHIAFLLVGLILGAGIFMSVNVLLKWHRAGASAQTTEAVPAKASASARAPSPAAPPPLPQPYQATSPVEAVHVMLKASLAGDRRTAYAQWDIAPNDVATVRQGQAITLAEITGLAGVISGSVNLADYQFSLDSQTDDQATVLQKRDGAVIQKFLLHRRGPYWKIRFASRP